MILLLNDDGIDAPGLRSLYRALRRDTGLPVLAVAPLQERSGQGPRDHAQSRADGQFAP
jgi:5'-nucleotidase